MRIVPFVFLLLAGAVSAQNLVAVFGLENQRRVRELDHLSESLPKSLRVSLLADDSFRVVEPDAVGETLATLSLRPVSGEGVSFENALKAADRLGADIAVIGSYTVIGERIRIDLEAVDTASRRIKTSASVAGESSGPELFDLVDSVCGMMAERMKREIPKETRSVRTVRSANVEEVYLASSRKDSWFYALPAMSAASADFRIGDLNIRGFDALPFLEFGYGRKRFRFRTSLVLPMFQKQNQDLGLRARHDVSLGFLGEFSFLAGRLAATAGYSWSSLRAAYEQVSATDFRDYRISMMMVETGLRYRPIPRLDLMARIAVPLATTAEIWPDNSKLTKRVSPAFGISAGAEFKFTRSFGLSLRWIWRTQSGREDVFPAYGIGKVGFDSHTFQLGPCYNMEF